VELSKMSFYLKQAFGEARKTRATLRQRLIRFASRASQIWPPKMVEQETVCGERITDCAAYGYKPPRYAGDVLLLQPRVRPGLVDHFPGWKMVVSGRLIAANVDGHHDSLLDAEHVRSCAGAISTSIREIERASRNAA
jgi:thioesterase domain-containing protein